MKSVKYFDRTLSGLLAIALIVAFAPTQVFAQDNERTYIQVRTVHVKGGMVPEYIELQKQFTEAMKADGRPGRSVWREIRGDLATFHQVSVLENFAANDESFDPPMDDDDWAEWVAAITNATHSSTRLILRTHPEWSTAPDSDAEPNLLYLRYRTVGQGQMGAYHDWIKNSLSPALKEGGADVTFSHIALGGNNRTWISATSLENWAAMDGEGPLSHMSDNAIDGMLGAANHMVVESENRLLQYRADLSF
jgi:hypothetical protein